MSLLPSPGPGPGLISGLCKKEKKTNIIPSNVNFGLSGYFIPISVEVRKKKFFEWTLIEWLIYRFTLDNTSDPAN